MPAQEPLVQLFGPFGKVDPGAHPISGVLPQKELRCCAFASCTLGVEVIRLIPGLDVRHVDLTLC
jgi:hypothetical protein